MTSPTHKRRLQDVYDDVEMTEEQDAWVEAAISKAVAAVEGKGEAGQRMAFTSVLSAHRERTVGLEGFSDIALAFMIVEVGRRLTDMGTVSK